MPDPCLAAEGGGCLRRAGDPPSCVLGEAHSGQDSDTGAWVVEGGAGGCAHASGGPIWFAVALVLLRRLLAPSPALAMDASGPRFGRAGDWATTSATLHEPWSLSAGLGTAWTADPVVLSDGTTQAPLVERVVTTDLGLGLTLGRVVELRVDVPVHAAARIGGEEWPLLAGDVGLDLVVAMGPRLALVTRAKAPAPAAGPWLTDGGVVGMAVAGEGDLPGGLVGLASAGLALQQPQAVPGSVWGSHLELVGGLARDAGPARAAVEVRAALPTDAGGGAAGRPVEVLPWIRLGGPKAGVRLGTGLGVGRGLGAPRARLFLAVDATSAAADRDADGWSGLRDLCPTRPEDRDVFRDADGCPDLDDDRDGFPDVADLCPRDPETPNGLADDDGCPDAAARLTVRVRADGPLDVATVWLGEAPPAVVLEDEPLVRTLPVGPLTLVVGAEGWDPVVTELALVEGEDDLVVTLRRPPPPPPPVPDVPPPAPEAVGFATGSAAPPPEPMLDGLAAWLLAHPEIALVRIEGHADDEGSPADNLALSRARAAVVRDALVARGVAPERLETAATGEALATGGTSTAERTVTFLVLVWTGAPPPPPDGARELFGALPDPEPGPQ